MPADTRSTESADAVDASLLFSHSAQLLLRAPKPAEEVSDVQETVARTRSAGDTADGGVGVAK